MADLLRFVKKFKMAAAVIMNSCLYTLDHSRSLLHGQKPCYGISGIYRGLGWRRPLGDPRIPRVEPGRSPANWRPAARDGKSRRRQGREEVKSRSLVGKKQG